MAVFITGDETGLLKCVDACKSEVVRVWGNPSRELACSSLHWFDSSPYGSEFYSGLLAVRTSGTADLYSFTPGTSAAECQLQEVKSIDLDFGDKAELISSSVTGDRLGLFVVGNAGRVSKYDLGPDQEEGSSASFDLPGEEISCCTFQMDHSELAFGGKDRDLLVFDVDAQKSTFRAKNLSHDKCNLAAPIWPTAISFFDDQLVGYVSAYNDFRLYDRRAQRKPVWRWERKDEQSFRFNCIQRSADDPNVFYCGAADGALFGLDIRKRTQCSSMRGFQGSVRAISTGEVRWRKAGEQGMEKDAVVVAGTGLDRTVRVYDCRSNALLSRTYIKQRANAITQVTDGELLRMLSPPVKKEKDETEAANGRRGADVEDDADELWDAIPDAEEAQKQRKNKTKTSSKKRVLPEDGDTIPDSEVVSEQKQKKKKKKKQPSEVDAGEESSSALKKKSKSKSKSSGDGSISASKPKKKKRVE